MRQKILRIENDALEGLPPSLKTQAPRLFKVGVLIAAVIVCLSSAGCTTFIKGIERFIDRDFRGYKEQRKEKDLFGERSKPVGPSEPLLRGDAPEPEIVYNNDAFRLTVNPLPLFIPGLGYSRQGESIFTLGHIRFAYEFDVPDRKKSLSVGIGYQMIEYGGVIEGVYRDWLAVDSLCLEFLYYPVNSIKDKGFKPFASIGYSFTRPRSNKEYFHNLRRIGGPQVGAGFLVEGDLTWYVHLYYRYSAYDLNIADHILWFGSEKIDMTGLVLEWGYSFQF